MLVGHPLLDRAATMPDRAEARRRLGIPVDAEVLALFPGSRAQEIERHLAEFEAVARELSDDAGRERGGEIGLRPLSRLPDLFVEAASTLQPGQVHPQLLRSGAGFHLLKLLDRREAADPALVQTRARHILLRVSPRASAEQAAARLAEIKREIESGARRFEDAARAFSEDGSAAQGGDLGWFSPGMMVPEFEQPASRLPLAKTDSMKSMNSSPAFSINEFCAFLILCNLQFCTIEFQISHSFAAIPFKWDPQLAEIGTLKVKE